MVLKMTDLFLSSLQHLNFYPIPDFACFVTLIDLYSEIFAHSLNKPYED